MKNKEIYYGFDSECQKQYENDLEIYFSKQSKERQKAFQYHKKEAQSNVKNWSKKDWKKSHEAFDTICNALTALLKQKISPENKDVQNIIIQHFRWLSNFWKPNKESYKGHAEFIMHSALRDTYNTYHPDLAEFLVKAMIYFSDHTI